jgi:hypothetical protein
MREKLSTAVRRAKTLNEAHNLFTSVLPFFSHEEELTDG